MTFTRVSTLIVSTLLALCTCMHSVCTARAASRVPLLAAGAVLAAGAGDGATGAAAQLRR